MSARRLTTVAILVFAFLALAATTVAAGVIDAAAASAETPSEVTEGMVDGVYVAPTRRSEVDPATVTGAVAEAAKDGVALVVVAPREAIPSTEAFALRVRQAAEADVALLFGPEGELVASVVGDYEEGANRAIVAAKAADSPGEAANVYVFELLNEPETEVPEIVDQLTRVVFYLLLALGAVVFAELALRKFKDRRIRI